MFEVLAELYSGRKVNGCGVHVSLDGFVELNVDNVCAKPFAELAIMNPDCPVVKSWALVSNPFGVSRIMTSSESPGFISRVLALGVKVAEFWLPGPGGPVGTPLV